MSSDSPPKVVRRVTRSRMTKTEDEPVSAPQTRSRGRRATKDRSASSSRKRVASRSRTKANRSTSDLTGTLDAGVVSTEAEVKVQEVLLLESTPSNNSNPDSSTSSLESNSVPLDPNPGSHNVTPGRMRAYHELPAWMQDNPFIHRGYRVDITWRQAFGSMFRLHNETFNVWTHALGFAFMTVLLVAVLTCMPQTKDFAYQHITGASSVNKGLGFVADLFGSGSGAARPVYAYHETMPRFCARYYDRYARFMALRGLSVDDTLPADQYMDGEVVLGPWAFPAQCKPLNHKVFSPSLAERTREYVRSVPEATRRELYRLKQSARRVFASVPLPSSLKSVYRGVADRYSDAKGWAEHQLEQHTANLTARAQETLGQLSSEWDHSVDAAVALYKHLLEHVLPVATAEDARAMKHPAFLAHYLDVGEEYTEDLATWPIVVFVISAMVCFGASAFFHLFSAVSWETYQVLSRMDYAGISLLIGGSNIPIMYYDFYCYQTLKWVYITGISVGCLVTFYITVHPNYVGSRFRVLRTVLFISLGLCGAVPFLHKALLGDFNPVTFAYMMLMGGLYIGGAVIYVTQIPERCLPGRCDIYCSSHQWWHCFVFAATMVHFMGVQYTYHSRIVTPCAPW